jgi:subtilisin family serine protease
MRVLHASAMLIVCLGSARADSKPAADCPMNWSPLIWSLYEIQAFDTGYDGTGVTVAMIDCGFPRHYEDYLPPGSVDETYAAGFGPMGWSSTSPGGQTPDFYGVSNFHSIATASTIVGFRTTPYLLETFGVGPCVPGVAVGAKILPIRAFPRNRLDRGGSNEAIAAAFRYVADLKNRGLFPGGLIVNASFEWDVDPGIVDAVLYAIDSGIIVTAAAGNSGPGEDTVVFPASIPEVIAVGGVGFTGEQANPNESLWFLSYDDPPFFPQLDPPVYIAGFSSRGAAVDLVAPAAWISWATFVHRGEAGGPLTPVPELGIGATSLAAPTVAGVAALMLEKNPTLVQADVDCILKRSALPIPASPTA